MKPYTLSNEEVGIVTELQKNLKTPKEQWDDPSVTDIKMRIKKHYISEQDEKCAYCKVDLHTKHAGVWDAEHIIDKDSFPMWIFEPLNLCISCKDCNCSKGNKVVTKSLEYRNFPRKSENYIIIHPHLDQYSDHIDVAVPGVTYRFKSEKGKKTIEICGLLRYHEIGGRKNIDPVLQAVLNYAGDKQTPEALKAAHEYLSKCLGISL